MLKLRIILCSVIVFALSTVLSGCSGEFETITVEGTNSSFAMPSGFKDGPLGNGHQYRGRKGDAAFVVVVYPRTEKQKDIANGITDEAKIKAFAKKMMNGIKKKLPKMGYAGSMRYDGIVENPSGYTVQYTVLMNERTVYNRFYITPQLIFYTDASADDPKNEDIKKFYDLFKP